MAASGNNTTKTIVVDLKIMPGDAVKTIQDTRVKIDNLKQTLAGMKQQGLENTATYIKLQATLKEMEQVVRSNQKVLRDSIREQQGNSDSINALRAQIRNLRAEYENLSKAERESAQGQDMLSKIHDMTVELKGLEEVQLDYTRNVGNYASALEGLPFGKIIAGFNSLSNGTGKLSVAFANAGKAAVAFGKQLVKLAFNPVVAAIMAVVAALTKLVNEIKKNDDAMTAMQRLLAAFKPILDLVNKGFAAVVDVVARAANAVAGFVSKIMSVIPGVKQFVDAEQEMVNATDDLEETERQHTVNSAKREKEIAELRDKSVQSTKYSYKERKKFLEDAIKLEQKELEENRDIAAEKYRIARQEAAMSVGAAEMTTEVYNKLSDEVKNHLAELEAAVYRTETAFFDGTRRMQSQVSAFAKQEENERKQAAQRAAQTRKERLKNEREAMDALRELYSKGIRNIQDAETAQTTAGYDKQISAIKEKLTTEKNLTVKAREALNAQIVLLEADKEVKLSEIREKHRKADHDKALQASKDYYQRLLSTLSTEEARVQVRLELNDIDTEATIRAVRSEVEELNRIAAEAAKDLDGGLDERALNDKWSAVWAERGIEAETAYEKMAVLAKQYADEAAAAATRTANNINAVEKAAADERLRIQKAADDKQWSLAQKHAEIMAEIQKTGDLESFRYNELAKTQIMQEEAERRLEVAKSEQARIAAERGKYTDEELAALYGSVDEFNLKFSESELKVAAAEAAVGDAIAEVAKANAAAKGRMIDTATAVMSAMNSVAGSVGELFDTLAESDEKYEGFALAMAEMQILISTAISIASAIQGAVTAAAATGAAAPFTAPAFITEMVALVAGALASATTTLLKAKSKKESAPQFAQGGLVGNRTSRRKDDSVTAKVSVGEYVIPSDVVSDIGVGFFDALSGKKKKKLPKIQGLVPHFAAGGLVQTPNVQSIVQTSQMFDYDLMKEVMAEAVSEVQPVVSVKEITAATNRVKVKERVSRS